MKKFLLTILSVLMLCGVCMAADLYASIPGGEKNVSGMEFTKAKEITEFTYTPTKDDLAGAKDSDILLVSFIAKAEKVATPVKVCLDDKASLTVTMYTTTQWSDYCLPVKASDLKEITLKAEGKILVSSLKVENKESADMATLPAGQHLLEDFTHTSLPEKGVGAGGAKHMMKSGNFIYSIGGGTLSITDVTDPNKPVVRGTMDNLGSNIRQICMCKSGTDVMITSRENGAYIVDVSNPDKPRLRNTYNSVEMCTGFDISGDTAFIANRQNGVEVVDISDLDNPVQRAIIRGGEVQDCRVAGNILYCGLWDLCRVDMYDISDLSNIRKIGYAQLTGKGDGMTVYEKNGKTYLFAATGQHTTKLTSSVKLTDIRYGMGNGLDIFDVTDPQKPVWLSTSRIDGRFYYTSNDMWKAEVAEKNGKLYAYLASTYNGVYIFDVTDMKAPIRLEHAEIVIPKGSSNYKKLTNSRAIVFPYDQDVAVRSAVGAIEVDDGAMYIAGVGTDVHVYTTGKYLFKDYDPVKAPIDMGGESKYYEFDGAGLQGYTIVRPGTQVYTVEPYEGKLFVALGSGGIGIYTPDLQQVAVIETEGICFDLTFLGDTLYTAEGAGGATAYKVEGTKLQKLWNYKSNRGVCRSVEVSSTGRFVALQTASNYFEIVATKTQKKVSEQKASAQMYHRNLVTFDGGRYLGAHGNGAQEFWYDCGVNDENSAPKRVTTITKTKNSMYGGGCQLGDKVMAVTSSGYVLYDFRTTGDTIKDSTISTGDGVCGLPSVLGKTLVLSNRIEGEMHIVDVSDPQKPKVMKSFSVPGNPDFALLYEGCVYVPMGYQGLMKFDFAPFDVRTEGEKAVAKFTDVKESDWFYSFVLDLVEKKVVSGMNETTFQPNGTLTYGQALKLLVVAKQGTDPGNAASGHWAGNYLAAAKKAGWLTEDVNLDASISRLSFCQIAAKAAKLTAQPEKNPFADCADASVLALVKAGVINGMTETSFAPDATLTRGQISKIISLLMKQ